MMARTPLIRYDASAMVRLLLHNEPPNIIKRAELEKEYEESLNNAADVAKSGQKKFQGCVSSRGRIIPNLPSASKNANQRLGN